MNLAKNSTQHKSVVNKLSDTLCLVYWSAWSSLCPVALYVQIGGLNCEFDSVYKLLLSHLFISSPQLGEYSPTAVSLRTSRKHEHSSICFTILDGHVDASLRSVENGAQNCILVLLALDIACFRKTNTQGFWLTSTEKIGTPGNLTGKEWYATNINLSALFLTGSNSFCSMSHGKLQSKHSRAQTDALNDQIAVLVSRTQQSKMHKCETSPSFVLHYRSSCRLDIFGLCKCNLQFIFEVLRGSIFTCILL